MRAGPASTRPETSPVSHAMRRRFKLLVVSLGVLAALVLVAVIAVPMLVDSDHYKRELITLVKARTGHVLHIDGDIRLHVFPGLRLTMTHSRLASPPGFDAADLARLPWLMVDVKLMPLLEGRIEPNAIELSGLRLNLERNRNGQGNWDAASTPGHGTAAGIPAAVLIVGALSIRDATIHWLDHSSEVSITASDVTLRTGALHAGSRIDDVRLQATLLDSDLTIEARGDVTLNATDRTVTVPELATTFRALGTDGMAVDGTVGSRITLDLAEQRLRLDGVRVSARASGSDEQQVALEIVTALGFDLVRQQLMASAVSLKVPEYSVGGIDGTLTVEGVLSGDLGSSTYTLERLQGGGTLRGEGLAGADLVFSLAGMLNADLDRRTLLASGLEVAGSIDGDELPFRFIADMEMSHRSSTLTASNMRLSLADWQLDGNMSVRTAASPWGVQGVLDLQVQEQGLAGSFAITESARFAEGVDVRFDVVAELDIDDSHYDLHGRSAVVLHATVLPAPAKGPWRVGDLRLGARVAHASFPDGELTVELHADLDVDAVEESVRTDNLRVILDDSRITGTVSVRGFEKPAVRFDLQADTIDADRYLPADGEGNRPTTPVAASVEAMRALDIAGEMRVQQLKLKGAVMEDVRLVSRAGAGGE